MAKDRKRDSSGRFVKNEGNWFKNAAKSLGYAGIEMLKTTMPATMETIDVNKEFASDVISSLRKLKGTNRIGGIEQQLSGKALENFKNVKTIVSNAKSDLKTGKFYNPERQAQMADYYADDDFDMDSLSFDMSDELNDENFDDSDSHVKVVAPNVTINSNIDKNNPMVKAVQQQTKMIADSEEASSKRDITIAQTHMKLDKELANVLYGGIQTINTNVSSIINFNNEHVGGYIGASLKYYEDNIRYMADISETLKKLTNMVSREEYNDVQSPMGDIINSDGGFSISRYLKLVKKQLGNTLDESFLFGSIKSLLFEGEGLSAIAQNPLSVIPQMVISKMMPEFLTNTLKSFDNSFKSFIPALLNKVGSWADEYNADGWDMIKGFIGSVLGVKNIGKTEIDLGAYEKGSIPFDGVTKKSIVEVIPGYLSKILSALTGKEELIFDSESGRFRTKTDIVESYDRAYRNAALSGYDNLDELYRRIDAFADDQEGIKRELDDFLVALAKRKKAFNPHSDKDYTNDFMELLPNGTHHKELQAIFTSLSPSELMKYAGSYHYNARQNLTDFINKQETTGSVLGTVKHNNLYGKDGDYLEGGLIKGYNVYSDGSSAVKRAGSIFTPSDKYGRNSLDYLRSIYKTLLEGIGVWYIKRPDKNRSSDLDSDIDYSIRTNYSGESDIRTDSEKAADAERGKGIISRDNKASFTNEQLVEKIREFTDAEDGGPTKTQSKKHSFSRVVKFLFGKKAERAEAIQSTVDDALNRAKMTLSNFVTRIDNGMYRIIFGENPVGAEDKKASLFSEISIKFKKWFVGEKGKDDDEYHGGVIGTIRDTYNKFHNYIKDHFFTPIKDAFIGKDGIITKFKESDAYKRLKESGKNAWNYLAGDKGEDGTRTGGLFSGVVNSFRDMAASTKSYFTGKDKDGKDTGKNSVFSEIKSIGVSFKNNIKEWLFGSDSDKTKAEAKGLLSDVGKYFKEGFQGFTDAIFGKKSENESNVKVDDIVAKIKERAPKSIASGIVGGGVGLLAGAGGFGLLGSLFLGPMSGVVIGTAAGFLSQSDKFKNWLFGEKDDNGERIGGFISKTTQNFFKEHKGAIIGGTTLGMLKGITGFGFLPSFILGGPITGALVGLGTSLLTKSEMFQKMLFGEADEKGIRSGGLLGKVTGAVNNDDIKKKLGFAGAGATIGAVSGTLLSSFGILGSIAFGPLSGAIIGAGAGIALAANKWKDAIFGKFDKDGKKTEQGILSKMMTAVSVEVLQPAKVQITEWKFAVQDWFAEKIAEPFLDSLEPLKEELKRFKDRLVNATMTVLDKLHITDAFNAIGDGIKKGFTNISKFVKNVAKTGINAIGKFTGFVLSSPVKLIHMVADKILLPKHMREGIASVRAQIIDNIKESDFVKKVIEPIHEKVTDAVTSVKDFTKKAIKSTFGFIWKGIKFIGKSAAKAIAAPFVGVFKTFQLVGKGIGVIRDKIGGGKRDTDRLSDITTGSGGNRSFTRSVGDLISLANPFSSLRRAAKYSTNDVDEVRQRIINSAAQAGETLTDDEIDKRVKQFLRKNPGGAGYQDARAAAREERANKRKAAREEHEATINKMREQLSFNQNTARSLGYNLISDEEKEAGSFTKFNKIIDKEYSKKYGKEYKSMSMMQKDAFKENKASTNAIIGTEEHTKETAKGIKELINKGIKIIGFSKSGAQSNKSTENTEDSILLDDIGINSAGKYYNKKTGRLVKTSLVDKLTAPTISADGVVNSEAKSENLKTGRFGITGYEAKAEAEKEVAEEKKASIFEKMTNLLESGNKERTKHNSVWSSIFSKKGLITGGLILLAPFIIKLLKEIGPALLNGIKSIASALGAGVTDLAKDYIWTEQHAARSDGNTIGEEFDKTVNDLKTGNILTDSEGNATTRTDSVMTFAARRALNWKYADYVNPLSSKTNKTEKAIYRNIQKTAGFVTGNAKYSVDDVAKAMGTSTDDVMKTFNVSAGQKIGTKDIAKVMGTSTDDAAKAMGKKTSGLPSIGKNAYNALTGGAKYSVDDVAKAMGTSTDDVMKTFGKKTGQKVSTRSIAKTMGTSADDVTKFMSSAVAKNGDDVAKAAGKTATKLADTAGDTKLFKKVSDYIVKFYDDIIKKFAAKTGKTGLKFSGKIASNNIIKVLKSMWNKVATKIATTLGLKGGVAAASAGMSEVIFATIGAVNGVSGTAKLFQVSADKVDGKMRLIAGIFGALSGTTIGSIVDLVFSLISPIIGVDILSSLAVAMYNLLANDKDSEKLASAQDAFKNEYLDERSKTLEEQYNTQKKAGIIGPDVTFEQFAQGVEDGIYSASYTSFEDWNVQKNKSLGDKIGSTIGKGVKSIGKAFSSAGKFLFGSKTETYTDSYGNTYSKNSNGTYQVTSSSGENLGFVNADAIPKDAQKTTVKKDGIFTKAGKGIKAGAVAVKNKVSDIFKPVSDLISPYANAGKELTTYMKDVIATRLKLAFDSDTDVSVLNVEKDDKLGSIKKVLYWGSSLITLPAYMILKVVGLVWNKIIKPIGQGVKSIGKGYLSVTPLDALKNEYGVFDKSYWEAPEDEKSGPMSTLGKVGFYAQRILTVPAGLVLTVANLAWNKIIKPVGEGILNVGKAYSEDSRSMFTSIFNGQGIFTKAYWTPPTNGDKSVSGLRKVGFYAQRILSAPVGLVTTVANLAWDKVIKPVGQSILNVGKAYSEDSRSMFTSIFNGQGIFTSAYWTPPTDENGATSGLRKVGFYTQRILFAPAGLVTTIGKGVADGLSSLWSGIKDFGGFIANTLDTSKATTEDYWKYNGSENENAVYGGLKKTLFYIARGLLAPGFYLNQFISSAANKVKKSISKIGDWFVDLFDLDKYFEGTGGGKGGSVDTKPQPGVGGSEELDLMNQYTVTSPFSGSRTINGKTSAHRGIDLSKGLDSPVYSFTDGTVEYVSSKYKANSGYYGSNDGGGFGNYVRIVDGSGNRNFYAHLNGVNVTEGQKVSRGTKIGIEGHTGSSTGHHLHYEVREGRSRDSIDPVKYLTNYNSSNSTDVNDSEKTGLTGISGAVSTLSNALTGLFSPLTDITSSLSNAFSSLLGSTESTTNTDSENADTTDNTNASKQIWTFFKNKGLSDGAVAGIMGNLYAESGLKSNNLQNSYEKKLGMNDEQYTAAVDNKTYGNFIKDSAGYGLAQWTYHTRKKNMLNFITNKGKSIGDLGAQLEFLWDELSTAYKKSVLDPLFNTTSVKDASTTVLQKFEKPATYKEASTINYRASLSQDYYDRYRGHDTSPTGVATPTHDWRAQRLSTGGGVGGETNNVQVGNADRFKTSRGPTSTNNIISALQATSNSSSSVGDKVFEYLKKIADGVVSIVNNTNNTNTKLEEIKTIEKERPSNEGNVAVIDNSKKTTNSPMYDIAANRRASTINKGYQTAKAIASGAQ